MRFFRRRRWDRDRAQEIQAYLDQETQDNVSRGMSREKARHAARRKLGNPILTREEIYGMTLSGRASESPPAHRTVRNVLAGLPLQLASVAKEPRILTGGNPFPGTRNRREQRVLQRDPRRIA